MSALIKLFLNLHIVTQPFQSHIACIMAPRKVTTTSPRPLRKSRRYLNDDPDLPNLRNSTKPELRGLDLSNSTNPELRSLTRSSSVTAKTKNNSTQKTKGKTIYSEQHQQIRKNLRALNQAKKAAREAAEAPKLPTTSSHRDRGAKRPAVKGSDSSEFMITPPPAKKKVASQKKERQRIQAKVLADRAAEGKPSPVPSPESLYQPPQILPKVRQDADTETETETIFEGNSYVLFQSPS
jgi:hypothetical protein